MLDISLPKTQAAADAGDPVARALLTVLGGDGGDGRLSLGRDDADRLITELFDDAEDLELA